MLDRALKQSLCSRRIFVLSKPAAACCVSLCCSSVVCRRRYRSPTLEIAKSVQVPGKNEGTRVLSSRACACRRRAHTALKRRVWPRLLVPPRNATAAVLLPLTEFRRQVSPQHAPRAQGTRRTRLAVLHAANAACRLAGLGSGSKALQNWFYIGVATASSAQTWQRQTIVGRAGGTVTFTYTPSHTSCACLHGTRRF